MIVKFDGIWWVNNFFSNHAIIEPYEALFCKILSSRLVAKKSTALQWPKFFLVKGKKGDFMTKLCFELVYSLLCLVFCHHLFKMVLVSLNSKLAVHFFCKKRPKKVQNTISKKSSCIWPYFLILLTLPFLASHFNASFKRSNFLFSNHVEYSFQIEYFRYLSKSSSKEVLWQVLSNCFAKKFLRRFSISKWECVITDMPV